MSKLVGKKECTGCGVCELVCQNGAIKLDKDDLGYPYPVIDEEKCIHCGVCKKACHTKKMPILNKPLSVYAFQTKNYLTLSKCGSGGFFSEFATHFIDKQGIVYGASMDISDSKAQLTHICVTNKRDISRLQGSKYAVSDCRNAYKKIEDLLNNGRRVFFSGTPCQVAGLKSYLRREYERLLTVDILCHGNSPIEIFNKYLKYIADKYCSDVTSYIFRNKEISKGFRAKIVFSEGVSRNLYTYQEGYWFLCQFSKIHMEACFRCPYTTENRSGDITCGDFWGIDVVRPDLYSLFNRQFGISAVMINTLKGQELYEETIRGRDDFIIGESNIEDVKVHGAALRRPNNMPDDYYLVLEMLKNKPYESIVKYSKKQLGLRYYKSILADLLMEYKGK